MSLEIDTYLWEEGEKIKIDDSPTEEKPDVENVDESTEIIAGREIVDEKTNEEAPLNIPVYTFITVLGAERGWKKFGGRRYPIWKAPESKTVPIRDMEIFLNEDLTIDSSGIEEYYKQRTSKE